MKTVTAHLTDTLLQKIQIALEKGYAIGFPTDTVYGLGVNMDSEKAHEHLYQLKQRPKEKAFIVHMGKIEHIQLFANNIPNAFYDLAEEFFPGALTIVLPKKAGILDTVCKNHTIACRIPNHPIFLTLMEFLQKPLIGTSANISREKNPISAQQVLRTFAQKVPYIIDGGTCPLKIPSTVLSLAEEEPIIYRRGAVSVEQIEKVLNRKVKVFCCI